jgi:hypothetical protein
MYAHRGREKQVETLRRDVTMRIWAHGFRAVMANW